MRSALFIALAALAGTADAGLAKCRPRPGASGTPTPSGPAGSTVPTGNSTVPVPPGGGTGNTTVPPPTEGINTTTPPEGGNTTARPEGGNAAAPIDPGTGNTTAPPPGGDNITAPLNPGTGLSPPAGADTSQPWNPADTSGGISGKPTPADVAGTSPISTFLLAWHNTVRAQYGSPPLAWNATRAQESADHTATCAVQHQGSDNLAEAWSSATAPTPVTDLVNGWSDEWPRTFSQPGAQGQPTTLNHLTMLLWNTTTSVGCSWNTDCPKTGYDTYVYLTCKYWDEMGNFQGQEAAHVGPYIGGGA